MAPVLPSQQEHRIVDSLFQPTGESAVTQAYSTSESSISQSQFLGEFSLDVALGKGKSQYQDLVFVVRCGQISILEVSQQHLLEVPGIDRMSVVRILFSFKETVTTYDLQALFITIQSGEALDLNDFLAACKIISRNGGYKYCPGLDENECHNQYYSVIRYHIKSVRLWEIPFKRVDSRNCII